MIVCSVPYIFIKIWIKILTFAGRQPTYTLMFSTYLYVKMGDVFVNLFNCFVFNTVLYWYDIQ